MNPYEADPAKVPRFDRYSTDPLYGRYLPRPDDFKPDPKHFMSTTPEGLLYWESVLDQCTEKFRMCEMNKGGRRDVFALGSVIIKSNHLKKAGEGQLAEMDHSIVDSNEVEAIALARTVLGDVKVSEVCFAGRVLFILPDTLRPMSHVHGLQIKGMAVLVQQRIPGVTLNVAWPYLTPEQKASFKNQARCILQSLQTIRSPSAKPSFIVPDPSPRKNHGIQDLEYDILFGDDRDTDTGFMHNDLTESNIIIDNDRIVAVIDWEMAGCFGWKAAGEVHVKARWPIAGVYADFGLGEERMRNMFFWKDLYEIQPN